MKKWFYILIFLPSLAFGQYDFETRYFSIDAETFAELPEKSTFQLKMEDNSMKKSDMKISDFFKVTATNYWQSVDMENALTREEASFVEQPNFNYPTVKSKEFGFSVNVNGTNSFNGTRIGEINNIAYKESRGVFLCNPSGVYRARQ